MRRIAILAFPSVQVLDVTGPAEVFTTADKVAGGGRYAVDVVATQETIRTSGATTLVADRIIGRPEQLDTLVAAGGTGVREAARDDKLLAWIRATAERSRRTASVCTGAFLLAKAGLLDGRRATTHWSACEALDRNYPEVTVDPDPIYVRDGSVYTSAGVTAGIDLALGLVEEDLGHDTALEVARWLVLYLKRPGGQSQFSAHLRAQSAEREPLRELQAWLPDHLGDDLSVPALAERAGMSPRNFARAFKQEVGSTPGAYVERLRVERARQALESSGAPVEEVARASGFGTVETMRRAFRRRLHVSPADYRTRFRRTDGHRHPAL